MPCDLLPVLLDVPSGAAPETSLSGSRASSGTEKGLKNYGTAASYLGLFPISEGHKFVQNFLQSLEPPFVVGGCPSISPVHACGSLLISAISSRSFLMGSDTSIGINTD